MTSNGDSLPPTARAAHPRRRARHRSSPPPPSGPSLLSPAAAPAPTPAASEAQWKEFDKAYFQSYAHVGIHEGMIKDHVRTQTYREAIMRHQDLISDKVVMDVGCGTGILSIFCALAGARRVYAVEASEIAVQANEVVKVNNLSDKITVLHGRVESMLGSVIFARDKWLKPGGLILPSHATLYMAPVTHTERYRESIDFWKDVYGINMSAMLPLAKQCAFEEPSIETITGENVLAWPFVKAIPLSQQWEHYKEYQSKLKSVAGSSKASSILSLALYVIGAWSSDFLQNYYVNPYLYKIYTPDHDWIVMRVLCMTRAWRLPYLQDYY